MNHHPINNTTTTEPIILVEEDDTETPETSSVPLTATTNENNNLAAAAAVVYEYDDLQPPPRYVHRSHTTTSNPSILLIDRLRKSCCEFETIHCTRRISSFIVRRAPCFWFKRRAFNVNTSTDRSVLFRLVILCAVFSGLQVAMGLFFIFAFIAYPYKGQLQLFDYAALLWNPIGAVLLLSVTGSIICISSLGTLKSIRQVDLVGAIRFFWFIQYSLPFEIFFVINMVDYDGVTNVFLKHWWITESLSWFRQWFCEKGTANTRCKVAPTTPLQTRGEIRLLCRKIYKKTDCELIRKNAIHSMETFTYMFSISNLLWGVVTVLLLFLTRGMLEEVITSPIVRKSKGRNYPFWLFIAIVICFLCYYVIGNTQITQGTELKWVGSAYFISGCGFILLAFLSWFIAVTSVYDVAGKRRKVWASCIFIGTALVSIISVLAILVTSLLYSNPLISLNLSSERGRTACLLDTATSPSSCSNCDNSEPDNEQCPEWIESDVSKVLSSIFKQSAIVACMLILFAIDCLRFGLVLYQHVSRYQVAYV